MLKIIRDGLYNRDVLIGRPRVTLKDFKCQNITCNKIDQFKKYKDGLYICECGFITKEREIEITHKVTFYCKSTPCIHNKIKMTKECLSCEFIGER